ncbi:MAG: DUF3365 domain-containing protein [Lutibacter sp.]|uniref:Tll0287-like domain-containing protein n=1 Tax=Lutibacter sp. TaxID=1925666 RepID=UPI00299CEEA5|nr:DUF3365 domain-containing protein [Lutibacter sp.]MDX1829425.1 DUF3365 domain-containing protein [Lutibacter sp.]
MKNKFKHIIFSLFLVAITISCNKSLTPKEKEAYLVKGKEISKESFKTLSGKLKEQLQKGGVVHAIPFCNSEALPITKELSKKFNVSIKRTSNKIRNIKNNSTARELEVVEKFITLKENNKELAPIVEVGKNDKIHFYAPIIMKNNCLVCHGTVGQEISVKNDSIIKLLYPNDKATNYKEGDVRGIWSITFDK